MSPDESFLHSLLEAPDEDGPRLVYADWLDDHGRPERAAFIRLQCRLADPATPGRGPNRRRALELLARRGFTWLGPVRKVVPGPSARFLRWDFGRGFVEKLTL